MPITWPATLPLPSIEDYGVHPGEAVLRTEMEAGPTRQRRRYTQVPSRISARWTIRPNQLALFESWYHWQAKEGNPHPFCSCSHGAGRRMSRNQDKKRFTVEDHAKATEGTECRTSPIPKPPEQGPAQPIHAL